MKFLTFLFLLVLPFSLSFGDAWLLSTSYPASGPGAGGELKKYKVNCEEEKNVPQLITGKHAYVLSRYPSQPPKGEIFFLTGGTGTEAYHNNKVRAQTVDRLLLAGYITRVLYWASPWFKNTGGVGFRRAACLTANAIEAIHSGNPTLPLCAAGNSGGSMQSVGAVLDSPFLQSIMTFIIPSAFPSVSHNSFCYGYRGVPELFGPAVPTGTREWHDWANGLTVRDLNRPSCYNFVNTSSPYYGVLPSQEELDKADGNAFFNINVPPKPGIISPFPKVHLMVSSDDLGPRAHTERLNQELGNIMSSEDLRLTIGPANGHKFDAAAFGSNLIVSEMESFCR